MADQGDFRRTQDWVAPSAGQGVRLVISWIVVGVPLLWGVWQTLDKARALFTH